MTASDIRLSVAIVTRNRPESLERCLKSLRAQSIQPFEVVVSDDSDSEFTTYTEVVAKTSGCHYIKGPNKGLYANRNFVILSCCGSHIRTMDDDHELPAGHIQQCLDVIALAPNDIWTTGEISELEGEWFPLTNCANQLGPSGVGYAINNYDDNWGIADGSTIYPRIIFDLGYRMVANWHYGASYLEFGVFLYKRGFKSRVIRNAYVIHHLNKLTLTRNDLSILKSRLFSSIAFNIFFKRNIYLFVKYFIFYTYLILKAGGSLSECFDCFKIAAKRR